MVLSAKEAITKTAMEDAIKEWLQDALVLDSDHPAVHERLTELIADASSPVVVVPDSAAALKRVQAAHGTAEDVSIVRSRSVAAVLSALAVHDAAEDPRVIHVTKG